MTMFWTMAAALLVAALLLVLPALLRARAAPPAADDAGLVEGAAPGNLTILREQLAQLDAELADGTLNAEQHRSARGEIERRALEEEDGDTARARDAANSTGRQAASAANAAGPAHAGRATKTAIALTLAVPLLATVLYAAIGNPQAINQASAQAAAAKPGDEVSMQDVEAMVAKLAERMQQQPGDPQGWSLLGRTYAAMQRFPEADKAYAKASALLPKDAQLLADHADVLAMMQGRTVAGEPEKLVLRALQIEPTNLKALALAGSGAFERNDFPAAIAYWTKARAQAPAGSDFAAGLDRSIDEARGNIGKPSGGAALAAAGPTDATGGTAPGNAAGPAKPSATAGTTAGAGTLGGTVSLAPALAAKVLPGDTLFVFVRAAEGPRMPLAIVRRTAADLPLAFTLDDSQAMSPAMKLSNFANVVVGARISKSGNAMPQPGDLTATLGPVATGSRDLKLVIDAVQP